MRELRILRKQVQAMWKIEETLSPKERECHQWQIVAMQGGVPYLVGKGGANTFFYRVGTKGEMQYLMPDKMFDMLTGWLKQSYVMYAITASKDIESALQSTRLERLKENVKDKHVGKYLVGVTTEGKVVRLFKLQKGLRANQWVPFSKKKAKR